MATIQELRKSHAAALRVYHSVMAEYNEVASRLAEAEARMQETQDALWKAEQEEKRQRWAAMTEAEKDAELAEARAFLDELKKLES